MLCSLGKPTPSSAMYRILHDGKNAAGTTNSGSEYTDTLTSTEPISPSLIQIEICDKRGNVLGPSLEVETYMKSSLNMRCYRNKPKETSERLRVG